MNMKTGLAGILAALMLSGCGNVTSAFKSIVVTDTKLPPIEKIEGEPLPPVKTPNREEAFYLAATIWAEARGEGAEGMRHVAHVIKNRVEKKRFPNTYVDVVLQKWQFSCWNPDDPNRKKLSRDYLDRLDPKTQDAKRWAEAQNIASNVIAGRLTDVTHGADHYHTKAISPKWSYATDKNGKRLLTQVATIGNHIFYR